MSPLYFQDREYSRSGTAQSYNARSHYRSSDLDGTRLNRDIVKAEIVNAGRPLFFADTGLMLHIEGGCGMGDFMWRADTATIRSWPLCLRCAASWRLHDGIGRNGGICTSCWVAMPRTGVCDECDQ